MIYSKQKWGFELVIANSELYYSKIKIILKNEKTKTGYNKKRDITIFVMQGRIILEIEGTKKLLKNGESYRIHPKIIYNISSLDEDSTVIEVGSKIEDDFIIIKD